MRLLFDQNLSARLTTALADLFPDSLHVRDLGLQAKDDEAVWNYAALADLVIVSKDSDFHQRSFLYGAPPKVVWIRQGNASTAEIEEILRRHKPDLLAFVSDTEASYLAIG